MAASYGMYFGSSAPNVETEVQKLHSWLNDTYLGKNRRPDLAKFFTALASLADQSKSADEASLEIQIARFAVEGQAIAAIGSILGALSTLTFQTKEYYEQRLATLHSAPTNVLPRRKRGRPSNAERAAVSGGAT